MRVSALDSAVATPAPDDTRLTKDGGREDANMELDTILLALFGLVSLLVAVGALLGWVSFFRVRRLRAALARANERLERLEGEATEAPPPVPAAEAPPVRRAESPSAEEAGVTAAAAAARYEHELASYWMTRIGAVALALAGVFLVGHSIERGWLGPPTRCALGAAGGVALLLVGEWLRRRARAAPGPGSAAAALTAAGVAVLFVILYAAHALYGLLPPAPAFVLLGAVAAGAGALALLHGPFIALLGVVGGYLAPALVDVDAAPSAPALFGYLAVLNGAAMWILRYRPWWSVGFLALAGAGLWPAVWLATTWSPGDAPAVGAYLAVSFALALYLPAQARGERRFGGRVALADALPWAAVALFIPLIFALVRADGYGAASLAALAAACLACLDAARRRDGHGDLAGFAAPALVLALAAVFHIGNVTDAAGAALGVDGWRYDLGRRLVPPALEPFLAFSGAFAALFAGFGYWSLWRARRPWLWAGLSAAAPPALLAVAFWRVRGFEGDLSWAAVAVGVAALGAAAAERTARRRERSGMDGALAAYAVGAAATLGLAMALSLQQAWLTVALSLQVVALAAIHDRLPLAGLRLAALATAAAVIVRLAFNLYVFDYAETAAAGFAWTLYGCGGPALAFLWAARRFGGRSRDSLVPVLEAGAVAFAALLVALPFYEWAAPGSDFGERSVRIAVWLAAAWGLYRGAGDARRSLAGVGWRVLGGVALAEIVAAQMLFVSPLLHAVDVGDRPILNLLLLAYGVPAAAGLAFLRLAEARNDLPMARVAGVMALSLVLHWLTLETRRAFHGGFLMGDGAPAFPSAAEWYAYSALWLVCAGVLLGFGLWRGNAALRQAALVLVAFTAVKLFLFDMRTLDGLWRVASFLGLGASLVAIAGLYRRFVLPPPAPPAADERGAQEAASS